MEIEEAVANMRARDEEAVLVSISHLKASAPTEVQTKMLVKADGSTIGSIGGGEVEEKVVKEAMEVIQAGKPRRTHVGVSSEEEKRRGMQPGGKLKFFFEPVLSLPTIFIFGGGNIPFCVAKIAKLLDFKITVIDNKAEFVNRQRFPEADAILVKDFSTAFPKLSIDELSYIVIATRSHQYDEAVLEMALKTEVKYIGVVASKAEKQRVFSSLSTKGVSQEILDRVHAPIGLDISAKTQPEIALSIMAEIVNTMRSPESY
jgi:xanthine dehydrogenase accessory factor